MHCSSVGSHTNVTCNSSALLPQCQALHHHAYNRSGITVACMVDTNVNRRTEQSRMKTVNRLIEGLKIMMKKKHGVNVGTH